MLSYHMANFQTERAEGELAELAKALVVGEDDSIMTRGPFAALVQAKKVEETAALFWGLVDKYRVPTLYLIKTWVRDTYRHCRAIELVLGIRANVLRDYDTVVHSLHAIAHTTIRDPDKVAVYYKNAIQKDGLLGGLIELMGYFPSDNDCKKIRVDVRRTNLALIIFFGHFIKSAAIEIKEGSKGSERQKFWQEVQFSVARSASNRIRQGQYFVSHRLPDTTMDESSISG